MMTYGYDVCQVHGWRAKRERVVEFPAYEERYEIDVSSPFGPEEKHGGHCS
jgi:hypothetical protein